MKGKGYNVEYGNEENEFKNLADSVEVRKNILVSVLTFISGIVVTLIVLCIILNFVHYNLKEIITIACILSCLLLSKIIYLVYRHERALYFIDRYHNTDGMEKIKYFFKILFFIAFAFPKFKKPFEEKKD